MAAGQVVVYTGGKLTKTSTGENATVAGNLVVDGNLTVTGASTTVNVEDLNVEQAEITLNYATGDSSSSANGAGIRIQDAVDSSTDATILWDNVNDEFDFSHAINVTGNISVSGTVDGVDIASLNTTVSGIDTSVPAIIDSSGTPAFNSGITKGEVLTLLNVEDGADVTDATNVAAAGAVMESDTTTASMSFVVDEDNMSSNSDTKVPTQQSVKAYVDAEITGSALSGGSNITINGSDIDLDANIDLGSGGDLTADILQANLSVMSPVVAISSQPNTGLTLNIGRAVCIIADGKIDHADNTSASKDLVVGIIMDDGATDRASNGYADSDDVPVAVAGSITVAAFSGSPPSAGAEVYLTTSGQLTATAPTSGAIIRVGYMYNNSENKILVQPQFIMDN